MPRKMSTATPDEKKFAGKSIGFGCLSWLIVLPIFLFIFEANIDSAWEPNGILQYIAGFIFGILLLVGGVGIGSGMGTLLDDQEVRAHRGSGPITNPNSDFFGLIAFVPAIVGLALLIRYLYLFIGNIGLWVLGGVVFIVIAIFNEKNKNEKNELPRRKQTGYQSEFSRRKRWGIRPNRNKNVPLGNISRTFDQGEESENDDQISDNDSSKIVKLDIQNKLLTEIDKEYWKGIYVAMYNAPGRKGICLGWSVLGDTIYATVHFDGEIAGDYHPKWIVATGMQQDHPLANHH